MDNRFDDLTKALGESTPRRQALRRLAGLFGGALLGCLAFGSVARADSKKISCCKYSPRGGCTGTGNYGYTVCVDGPCPKPGSCFVLSSFLVSDCTKCYPII